MLKRRRICDQHLFDAIELRRRLCGGLAILASNEHVDRSADGLRGRHRLGGGVLQVPVVVFGEDKGRHQRTPASFFSLPTSSATELTFPPALRTGGSVVLRSSSRGVISTP